jgi:predicted DNA-binding transcriptional regulator YafY
MDDFVCFDRYTDCDPYTDEAYIRTFRLVLQALTEKRKIRYSQKDRHGNTATYTRIPYKLEYSSKDDKFRLITGGGWYSSTINLARITEISLLEPYEMSEVIPPAHREASLVFVLTDERNALERVMLHFSDCRKETRRIDEKHYTVTLWYNLQDETEMLIRVLSFGQMIRVTGPESFVQKLKERIVKQQKIFEGCPKAQVRNFFSTIFIHMHTIL